MQIFVKVLRNQTITFEVTEYTCVAELKNLIQGKTGVPADSQRLIFAGKQLEDLRMLCDHGIHSLSTVHQLLRLSGGKPAIYLMSPTPLSAITVSIALSQEWEFSMLYPLTTIFIDDNDQPEKQSTSWTVSVSPNGTIFNEETGRESSYLFWEATTVVNASNPITTPKSLLESAHDDSAFIFNPANPMAFFGGAHITISLPFDRLEPYLDSVLKGLTLTPAMRTEFMVYWLPSFQRIRDRDQHIKFTLVPQDAFNKAAELTVDGATPKTVARIFMLFGGAKKPYYGSTGSHSDEELGQIDWAATVGLDVQGMRNESAFRVLEWGGMEVPTSMAGGA